jgi:hypothetical protein
MAKSIVNQVQGSFQRQFQHRERFCRLVAKAAGQVNCVESAFLSGSAWSV